MALFGNLDVLAAQAPQHDGLKKGIEFLQNLDLEHAFAGLERGTSKRIDIDGAQLYALCQVYDSKPLAALKFEGHKRYIDIQFIYQGREHIGVAGLERIHEPAPYNPDKDVHLPRVQHYANWLMQPGEAAVLFPADLHAPGMAIDQPELVKKVVLKIAY